MIEKVDNNQIQDVLEKSLVKQNDLTKNLQNNNADASLQVDHESLIEKAIQVPQTDVNVVQQAQELLLSGQLDSPENIQTAAENIIKFGI